MLRAWLCWILEVFVTTWATLTLASLAELPFGWVILFLVIMEGLPVLWITRVIQKNIFTDESFIGGCWAVMLLIVYTADLVMFFVSPAVGASWGLIGAAAMLSLSFLFLRARITDMASLLAKYR